MPVKMWYTFKWAKPNEKLKMVIPVLDNGWECETAINVVPKFCTRMCFALTTWRRKKMTACARAGVLVSFINKLYTIKLFGISKGNTTDDFYCSILCETSETNNVTKSMHTFEVIIVYFIRLLNTGQKI